MESSLGKFLNSDREFMVAVDGVDLYTRNERQPEYAKKFLILCRWFSFASVRL